MRFVDKNGLEGERFNSLSQRKKIVFTAGGILAFLIILSTAVYATYSYIKWNRGSTTRHYRSTKEIEVAIGEPKDVESPINGVLYTKSQSEIFMNRRPLAIMVNNHVDARPQYGLSEADIIYEAVAEGGITRFLAVFHANDADKVGPVRSARVYYEDWAAELNAFYAHWGGSYMDDQDRAHRDDPEYQFTCHPDADSYAKINRIGLPSLDQMWLGDSAYWRDTSNGAALEHTGFTSTQKLYSEAPHRYPEEGWQKFEPFGEWLFKDDVVESERPTRASLSFSFWEGYPDYDVVFEYDPPRNEYLRSQQGVRQVDAGNGEELRAKTVIVQFTKEGFFGDRKGHLNYQTVGTGTARVFLDGKVIEAEWRKGAVKERTRYFDAATGDEIKFNRGQIWVEIVPEGRELTYTK